MTWADFTKHLQVWGKLAENDILNIFDSSGPVAATGLCIVYFKMISIRLFILLILISCSESS